MSPDVGEEGWVPLDDPLARIPDLIEYLKAQGDLWDGKLWEAAEALESAQARIGELTEEVNRLTYTNPLAGEWAKRAKEAEQRAERYRAALEKIDRFDMRGLTRPDSLAFQMQRIAMHALAPDPARPATEPDIIFDSPEAEAKFWRTVADDPQEDDDG